MMMMNDETSLVVDNGDGVMVKIPQRVGGVRNGIQYTRAIHPCLQLHAQLSIMRHSGKLPCVNYC